MFANEPIVVVPYQLLSSILYQLRHHGTRFGMDFIGPLHRTENGNCYILTISDYCSKWVDTYDSTSPMPTPKQVAGPNLPMPDPILTSSPLHQNRKMFPPEGQEVVPSPTSSPLTQSRKRFPLTVWMLALEPYL